MRGSECSEVLEDQGTSEDGSEVQRARITLRLPQDSVDMIDGAVKAGFAKSRSDALRKVLGVFQQMGGPARDLVLAFIAHILNEPLELAIWIKHRAALIWMDDASRRREAGAVTLMLKAGAMSSGALGDIDLGEIRGRLIRTMSAFHSLEPLPEPAAEAPPTEAPSLAEAFEPFVSGIRRRIREGAGAEEISDRIVAILVLLGTSDYYKSEGVSWKLDGVTSCLLHMATAGDINDFRLSGDAAEILEFENAYENLCLLIPELYDNRELREEVYEQLLVDLGIIEVFP